MKNALRIFALLLSALQLCSISAFGNGTDITPNPANPGNLGQVTNQFPNLYTSNAVVQKVSLPDGSQITSTNQFDLAGSAAQTTNLFNASSTHYAGLGALSGNAIEVSQSTYPSLQFLLGGTVAGGFGVNGFIDQYGVLPPSTSILTNQQSGVLLNGTFSGTTVGTFVGNVSGQFNGTGAISNALIAAAASTLIGTLPAAQLPPTVVTNTYDLRSYGAYGDAVNGWGAMAVSNSTTFTVTSGNFSSADVGKFINIKGADINRRDWWTTITAVNSATSITVASAVPVSYNLTLPGKVEAMSSGYSIIYGAHDDSMAMQSWVNQITNGGGKFYAPPGVYLILNPPTNSVNSQIVVPSSYWFTANDVTLFEMYGSLASQPGFVNNTPRIDLGPNTTIFVTSLGTSANPGQWLQGMPSSFLSFQSATSSGQNGVTGARVQLTASGFYITNTLTWPQLHDFVVQGSYDPSAIMINELGAQEGRGPKNVVIGTFWLASFCPLPLNTNGFGFVGPCNYSGQAGDARDLFVSGFYTGIDPGCTRLDYPIVICCKHAIAAMFTGGGPQVNHINEAQLIDCAVWLYGSGDTNFYSATGSASTTFNPRMDVIAFANNSAGEQNPDWQTNNPFAIYDPSNLINHVGCLDIAGWVRFPQIDNGPVPLVVQGAAYPPSVFPIIDVSACSTPNGQFGPALSTITMQPQVFGGYFWATNGMSISNSLSVVGSSVFNGPLTVQGGYLQPNAGINETLPSGYYITLQSLNSFDENDIGIGNYGSGRTTEWIMKTDDRYGDGVPVADLMFGPKTPGGGYYNGGFGGYGATMMLWTNGDESVLGSLKASNNVISVSGQFIGNAVGLTNFWYQTNFARPTVPTGQSGIWVSNGWMYYLTAQHPNGVLISAP